VEGFLEALPVSTAGLKLLPIMLNGHSYGG
jgi:hypothetical protein